MSSPSRMPFPARAGVLLIKKALLDETMFRDPGGVRDFLKDMD